MNKLFITTILIMIGTLCSAQELTFKYSTGKTYRYGLVSATSITQEMMGQEMKMAVNSNLVYHLDIEKVNAEGDITYIGAIDSSTQSLKSPMKDTTIVGGAVIGKRIRTTISKEGKILAKEILDSMIIIPMGGGDQRAQTFREHQLDASKPAVAGSQWTSINIDTMIQSGIKMIANSKTTCTVKRKEKKASHDCIVIEYTGTIKINGEGNMMGMSMTADGKGKIKGKFYFDPVQGVVVSDDNKMDLNTTIGTNGQQPMTIPIKQSMKTTRTLLEN